MSSMRRITSAQSAMSPSKMELSRLSRAQSESGRRFESSQCRRPVRHPGTDRYPRARVRRNRRARLLCRGPESVPRRLHLPCRRNYRGGCRLRRLAQFRRFQGPHHRSLQDARAGVPQHRGQRHARREIRERSQRHGSRARGRDGAAPQGPDRGHQDRALCRTRMDPGGARRGGRHPRQNPGDGGFRERSSGAPAGRSADQETAPRRHLHPLLFRPAPRTRRQRQSQSGNDRRPQARRHLRRGTRRRQLRLAHRGAGA